MHAVEVETGGAGAGYDGPSIAMEDEVASVVGHGVKCDAVGILHVFQGDDVGDSLGVVPDLSVAVEVSNSVDDGFAAIGADRDGFVHASDVGEEVAVAEDVDGGLVVEEHAEAIK